MVASLINVLGFTTGAILYAMLLWMVVRSHPPDQGWVASSSDRLSLLTGVLGLFWNIGAFSAYGLPTLGLVEPSPLLMSFAFSALGFLPAVVVHSVLRSRGELKRAVDRSILYFAYALSFSSSLLHVVAALRWHLLFSPTAFLILMAGFAAVMIALLIDTRKTPGSSRALWVVALAVFAVSALHLSKHTGTDPWWLELLGHHASLPLALAFLHQDYRFALADIFLKRALALILLVCLVFGIYAFGVAPVVTTWTVQGGADEPMILMLLAMWVGTALVYPLIRSFTAWFVDTVVLERPDYDMLLAQASQAIAGQDTAESILEDLKGLIGPALCARSVQWRTVDTRNAELVQKVVTTTAHSATLFIPTVDMPQYAVSIAELEGGRRLLSDDIAAIEKLAHLVARRIDAIRTAHERFERDIREREISQLASEAELRALRAQIHPHFLFNALTTIGYLIQAAPDKALSTLMRLSGLLRSVLRSSPEFSTLGEELAIITAYLDIESARFEDRLSVNIDVSEDLRQLRIPSLLLQPIVENAVKHGISESRTGGQVRISANLTDADSEGASLRLVVEDTGAGGSRAQFASGRSRGVGLNNVEKRLNCYGKGTAQMQIISKPGIGTHIELVLPLKTIADPVVGVK
ncbi:MAG TPA: histidine kinase [Terriglobia bacterium]|nr:histidine kinase [Terriglobia bacterium]